MRHGSNSQASGRVWLVPLLIIISGVLIGGTAGILVRNLSEKIQTTPRQMMEPPFEGRKQIYILALGEDETFSKNNDVRGRTDTMLVVAVDLQSGDTRAISIPRDTRCRIPGRDYDKINAAYVYGGAELSRQTAEMLLGVAIPYYVKTNIEGLTRTVDLVGGVEIDIEKNMRYRDRRGGLDIDLKKGHRHLDGEKALHYVRFRHDTMGDISRITRQQKFLRAIARRMLATENIGKLPAVINEIMQNVETNMSGKDLLHLVKLSRKIQPEDLKMDTLPGVPETISGISYWIPDLQQTTVMVDELLRFRDVITAGLPTIEVLNGAGTAGSAARVSEYLQQSGYKITSVGNVPNFGLDRSEIRSRIGETAQVKQISSLLNVTRITDVPREDSTEADLTVVVGKDLQLQGRTE